MVFIRWVMGYVYVIYTNLLLASLLTLTHSTYSTKKKKPPEMPTPTPTKLTY